MKTMRFASTAVAVSIATLLAACSTLGTPSSAYPTLNGAKPLVIGHRGASGYLPEQMSEAELAAAIDAAITRWMGWKIDRNPVSGVIGV